MRTAVLLSVFIVAAGCKAKKQDNGAKQEPAAAAERPAGQTRPGLPRGGEALRRMALLPISLDEVEPLIPALQGASRVGKPGTLTGGKQVKAVLCAPSESPQKTADALAAELERLEFGAVRTKPHPRRPEVIAVAGEKAPYRVTATVQRGPYADCPEQDGKAKIILSYFKRAATAAGGQPEVETGP